MASPNKIQLSVKDTGIFDFTPQDEETAAKTSELLQKNHDEHHIFFNKSGMHNHVAHHLLSLYGLGAPASVIEAQYNRNASYQCPIEPAEESVVTDMSNYDHYKKCLGDEKYYHDFLLYFQREMEKKGWENVLNEYMFAGDEKADDMLVRMFGGQYLRRRTRF